MDYCIGNANTVPEVPSVNPLGSDESNSPGPHQNTIRTGVIRGTEDFWAVGR